MGGASFCWLDSFSELDKSLDKFEHLRESVAMESGGGTRIWCPKCEDIKACKVLWYDNISKGNFFDKDFPDLQWRERPRECNTCGTHFNTYEISSFAIKELIALRKALELIESDFDKHILATKKLKKQVTSALKGLKK